MLLLRRTDGRVQGYVGQTTSPRPRLLQHRRSPPLEVDRALRADGLSPDNIGYVPLEIVPLTASNHFEALWTIRAAEQGRRSLNAFAAVGHPARTRIFWARRHARSMRVQVQGSDTSENVIVIDDSSPDDP
jgi:hypothetical protein